MFKNFFRKVRATLKNSPEAIALATGFFAPGMSNPMAKMAMNYLPQIATSQYQDNPLAEFLKNQAISAGGQYLGANNPLAAITNQPMKVDETKVLTNNRNIAGVAPNHPSQMFTETITENVQDKNPLEKILSGFFDKEGELTGKGKLAGSLASTFGPGLMTYLALMQEGKPDAVDAKDYRSAVDEYYAAKARGEDPNPADFGLAPTPAEDMVKDLAYNQITDSYEDRPAARAKNGGVVSLFGGGDVEQMEETLIEGDPRQGLLEVYNLREQANLPRRVGIPPVGMSEMSMSEEVVQAKTGGVIGLALGGNNFSEEVVSEEIFDPRMSGNQMMSEIKKNPGITDLFPRKLGEISGPGGPKDDKIPAMLSDGEFVMTAKAVENAGGPEAMYNMMNKLDPESSKGRGII